MEVACDESGYEGEKLMRTTTDVFAHAAVSLDLAAAAECVRELRHRIRSPAVEYKANHLLRQKHRSTLVWFLGPAGPLRGHAQVYLVEKVFMLVNVVAADPRHAYELGRGRPEWDAFLIAANDHLRAKGPLDDLRATAARLPAALRAGLLDPDRLADDPTGLPPTDPLIPAIVRTVARHGGAPVTIVHDRQTTLPYDRIARLKQLTGGRLADLRLVDSALDPRVQMADFLAGIATRRIADDELHHHGDDELTELFRPYVDPGSVWGDAPSWHRLTGTEVSPPPG